ncbi:MAG: FAD-dependent oxidoreductase [Ruminococcaceae bacterium]|nr:FAD-dependent oxidoreductase [Oscillospiraceae bacterium]
MNYFKEIECDVLVAGGGVAGAAAALSVARKGKKVILTEKATQLGGLATIGLINFFVPMCNGRGVQIIKGMADEFLKLSAKYSYDTIPDVWLKGEPGFGKTNVRLTSRYSAPIFSLVLCKELNDAGVEVMFDTVITDSKAENGKTRYVTLFNKSGFIKCGAKIFIDATGDSDLLHFAGVKTVTGGNYHSYWAFKADLKSCQAAVESKNIEKLTSWITGGGANLYGGGHPEGKPLWDGTDGDQVSKYFIENQLELLGKLNEEDRKERDILELPIMPQFRTTRHIDGDYTLKEEDAYKHFEDSVCAICDFDRRDYLYEVPYRTMVRRDCENIIAAGRCASGEGYGWDVLRVIPPAILTGQAAGDAAVLAIDNNKNVAEINVKELQNILESENVMIHFKDEWIPEKIIEDRDENNGHF